MHHETAFQRIRFQILQRDEFTCQYCGAETKEIHHIDGNRANNKPENLLAACRKCNNKRRKAVFGRFKKARQQQVTTTKEGFREYMRLYMRHRRAGIKTKFHAPWLPINDPMKTTSKEGKRLYMRNYIQAYRTKIEKRKGRTVEQRSIPDFM